MLMYGGAVLDERVLERMASEHRSSELIGERRISEGILELYTIEGCSIV